MANNSRWISFTTIRNEHWRHGNVVILGDAAHTAYSIGSGTARHGGRPRPRGLPARARQPRRGADRLRDRAPVQSTQRGPGQPGVVREPRPVHPPAASQFAFNIRTPQPPGHPRQLRVCDPSSSPASTSGSPPTPRADAPRRPRCSSRSASAASSLANRVVVSPMDMYVAKGDGVCPPTSTSPTSAAAARRRGPGHDRDGLCLPQGPDHPGLHGPLGRRSSRPGPGSPTSCTATARRRSACAGPLGPQGLDEAHGRASTSPSRTATGRSSPRHPLPAGCQPGAREMTLADMAQVGRVRRLRATR